MFIFKETGARNGRGSGIRLVDLVALAPSTQTNVYRSSIICICKVHVAFYQTLSLFHLTQCHIDPSRLPFLVLSG